MNIDEALVSGHKHLRGISRYSENWNGLFIISSNDKLNLVNTESKQPYLMKGWQPTLDDLTANDWYVFEQKSSQILPSPAPKKMNSKDNLRIHLIGVLLLGFMFGLAIGRVLG